MNFETSIKNAADVDAICTALRAVPIGETITYAVLSTAIGVSIQHRRYIALAAMKRLSKESGALFVPVYRIGYKRLPPQESHIVGISARARIGRAARRAGQKIIRAVQTANDMPRDAAMRANREIAMLGLIEHASTDKATNAAVTESKTPKPVARVMADMLEQLR